jgi:hypothetical protein
MRYFYIERSTLVVAYRYRYVGRFQTYESIFFAKGIYLSFLSPIEITTYLPTDIFHFSMDKDPIIPLSMLTDYVFIVVI